MTTLTSALATIVIFLAPGLVLTAWLSSAVRGKLTGGERIYLIVAGSLLVSGWVGLLLAELGRFSPARVATIVFILTAVGAVALRRRLSLRGSWEGPELIAAGLLVAFAVVNYFPPFDYVLGGRDPGVYVNIGFHLSRDGQLLYEDDVVKSMPEDSWPLFFPDKVLPDWSYLRFQGFRLERPETARVVPHGLHLYPVWIGMASGLYQMKSGLYATPFFALMGALGMFLAFKRLFGFETACWGAGLLTVFQIQIWFARFPNSEVVVQFLYATALLLFAIMEAHRSSLAGALSGFALGSTFLTRFETVLFVIPVGLYFGWKRVHRELDRADLAFLGALAAVSFHAAVHDRTIAWPYVSSILGRHYWRAIGDNLLLVALAGLVVFAMADRLAIRIPRRFLDRLVSDRMRLASAAFLFLLALYAYFVRPLWHGPRTAPHDAEAFLRMGWYLYPAGLALTIGGGMMLLVRARRAQALFLLVALTFSLFFFYKVRVWHDHYFAMRRFIPVILPSFFAAIAVFLTATRSVIGRLGGWVPRLAGLALFAVFLVDGTKLWARIGHNEFRGSIDFVEELARHFGERDIVFFPHQEGLHLLELPLSEMQGRNVVEFYTLKPPRDVVERLLDEWHDVYGDIYFITNYKISLSGLFTRHVKDFWFATEKYEYGYQAPPSGPEPFHLRFTLSKAVDLGELSQRVPPLTGLDVGGSDELQVAWFHEKEFEEDGTTYRWSERDSSIFLPTLESTRHTIALRMAGPKEDEAPLHPVEVRLDDVLLDTIELDRSYKTYEVEIPPELRAPRNPAYAILRLSSQTWRPSNSIPEATDVRDLGIRLDWVKVR